MREIKYRAWDKIKKRMKRVISLSPTFGSWVTVDNDKMNGEERLSSEFVLMQFTGLLDKNGKEIWEGDVVEAEERFVTPKTVRYEIVFEDGMFLGHGIGRYEVYGKGERFVSMKPHNFLTCKVIGNIYSDPHLLEAK